jgi:putative sugar O-methyltransferase
MLLDELIKDEKKIDRVLYSSGPYWSDKNNRTVVEIKKKGLNDFRGITAGIGTSFADNEIVDIRQEFNTKGRIVGKIFSLPFFKKIFNDQLKLTNKHLNSSIKNKAVIYQNKKNVQNLIKKNYSTLYMEMAFRIDKLSKSFNFENNKSFFEIGGGFGANVHFLLTNFPNIKKVLYLDAVPNIYVGTEYLRSHYKDKVKDYLELKNLDKISFSNNDELEILCMPPWLIEKVDVEIDHFHNAASFVEMPKKVVENYSKFVKKFKSKEVSLVSYDGFDLDTTPNPEELNEYFDNNLKISWEKNLIEEFKSKTIFLASQ